MSRKRKQALVYVVLAIGVLELLVAAVLGMVGHGQTGLFVGGVSFVVAALLLAFVFDVRPGGEIS